MAFLSSSTENESAERRDAEQNAEEKATGNLIVCYEWALNERHEKNAMTEMAVTTGKRNNEEETRGA